jgi:type VI protein secretion system component VasK
LADFKSAEPFLRELFMYLVLLRYWLRRFTFTFIAAVMMLFYWNYTHYGLTKNMLINTWSWALVAATIASSLTTYLAYRRYRKAAAKEQEKSSVE